MLYMRTPGYVAFILISALILSVEGCGTIITRFEDINEEYFKWETRGDLPSTLPRIYSGTWLDLWAAAHPRKVGDTESAIAFWDIPLSLAVDTVLLPFTAYEQIRFGSFGNDAPPLVLAVREGELSMVQALLDGGADANAKTKGGRTALVVAAGWGHAAVAQALLDAGAEVNASTADGVTPLMAAADEGYTDVVQALLDKDADVNARTADGATPLMAAAGEGHTDVVQALLDKGADVNARTANGVTPLIAAAAQGNTAIIQVLLDRGADVNAKTTHGWTALRAAAMGAAQSQERAAAMGAAQSQEGGAVELLKRAGAKE